MINNKETKKSGFLKYYLFFFVEFLFFLGIFYIKKIKIPINRISYQTLSSIDYLSKLNFVYLLKNEYVDPLSKTISFVPITPYEKIIVLLKKSLFVININLSTIKLLFFLNLLCFVIIIYLILKILNKFEFSNREKDIFMFIFLFSPITLFLIFSFSYHVLLFILFLILLLVYIGESSQLKKGIVFGVISLIVLFFGVGFLMVIILSLILGLLINKKIEHSKEHSFGEGTLFVILLMFLFGLLFKLKFYNKLLYLLPQQKIFIYDLGGLIGFSIFTFSLFIIGLFSLRKTKKESYFYYGFSLTGSLFYFLFGIEILIYFGIFVYFVATKTMNNLMIYRKSEEIIKKITLYSILFGILFSGLSFGFDSENSSLNLETSKCLEKIQPYNSPYGPGVVLSDYSNSFFIKEISKQKVVLDDISMNKETNKIIYDEIQSIFYNINIKKTKNFLNKYDIKYIVITDKMIYDDIWYQENQGLDFVVGNREEFEKVCSIGKNGGIWLYKNSLIKEY